MVCRRARGPLAVGALCISLSWLLQPMGLATFPLALLLAGCALPAVDRLSARQDDGPISISRKSASDRYAWLLVPGLFVAAAVGAVDLAAHQRYLDGDSAGLAAIIDDVPDDAVLADIVAQHYEFSAKYGDMFAARQALVWRSRSTDIQPDRSRWWVRRALLEGELGDFDGALRSVDTALELEPNSWSAVDLKVRILDASGDDDALQELMPLACALAVPSCEE
jgi:hypothetical protein